MKNMIPNELVAALVSDARLREQFTSMYLVQQEIMAALTAQLHRHGLVDAWALADHVLSATQEPELGELAPDLGRVFYGRLRFLLEGQAPGANDLPPQ